MLRDLWLVLTGRLSSGKAWWIARDKEISHELNNIHDEILKLRNEFAVTFNDELSPKRKELSDELRRRMQAKLIAEDKARRHTEGRL